MGEAKAKRLARLLAQDLFTTGYDHGPVDVLKSYRGTGVHESYMGGWSQDAVAKRIENILKSELADSD